jgi:hypothetical protein
MQIPPIMEMAYTAINFRRFWRFTGMADNVFRKHNIVREIAELRWRINKLEEMKKGRGWKEQMTGTEEELPNQSQSTQFFLGLGLSQVFKTEDESAIETNIERRWGYKNIKGGL